MCLEGVFNSPVSTPAVAAADVGAMSAAGDPNFYGPQATTPAPAPSNPVMDWFKGNGDNISLAMQSAGVVSKAFGAYYKSKLEKDAYNQQADIAGMNAANDAVRARDAVAVGQDKATALGLKYGQLFGTQRAMLAARGIDVGEGSPVLSDTEFARNNDYRINDKNTAASKFAADVAYSNDKNQESLMRWRADAESPFAAGFSTILGEAGTVASHWYKRKA